VTGLSKRRRKNKNKNQTEIHGEFYILDYVQTYS
jgi:hypothetical protein